jgi:hypothetical protein
VEKGFNELIYINVLFANAILINNSLHKHKGLFLLPFNVFREAKMEHYILALGGFCCFASLSAIFRCFLLFIRQELPICQSENGIVQASIFFAFYNSPLRPVRQCIEHSNIAGRSMPTGPTLFAVLSLI